MTETLKKRGVIKMENTSAQQKPRIFELWDQIMGTDSQEYEATKQRGIKRNDRQ